MVLSESVRSSYLSLRNIYIRFGSTLYRQIVANCVPLSVFALSLLDDNQSEVLEAFNSTSWYLDDLLNIDNNFFDSMVNHIYPSELQLNKVIVSVLGSYLFISDGFVKT